MSQKRELSCIVLAAGQGTRMKSENPKVLFTVCGRPIVSYVLDAVSSLTPDRIVVVIGYGHDQVKSTVAGVWAKDNAWKGRLEFARQEEQKGTAHAVDCAREALAGFEGDVLVLYGDSTPLLTGELLQGFYREYLCKSPALSLVTSFVDGPTSYGRIVRDQYGNVTRIVEARDLADTEADIKEVNSGIYLARREKLFDLVSEVKDDNAKHEFYLTDIIQIASAKALRVSGYVAQDPAQVQGINDRYELAQAEDLKRREILKGLALAGVTVRDPASTYVDYGVPVGRDTVIEPQTYLRGKTIIGSSCVIGPGAEVLDSSVGDRTRIWFSVVEDSEVGCDVQIGPYSHIRPNSRLSRGVLVGNFAEIKNSLVGQGAKIHHHSYIGDTDMGERVNVGAGTVTVNYDGIQKHRTIIEDGAFIGCNANLIAPVKVGKGAYVAAGSTINLEVPEGSLAIAREYQVNKEGWAAKRKQQGR